MKTPVYNKLADRLHPVGYFFVQSISPSKNLSRPRQASFELGESSRDRLHLRAYGRNVSGFPNRIMSFPPWCVEQGRDRRACHLGDCAAGFIGERLQIREPLLLNTHNQEIVHRHTARLQPFAFFRQVKQLLLPTRIISNNLFTVVSHFLACTRPTVRRVMFPLLPYTPLSVSYHSCSPISSASVSISQPLPF